MRAVDTNILLRIILNDDPAQSPLAVDMLRSDMLIPHTVLLETGWVLRSRYSLDRLQIADSLIDILDLATVHIDDEPAIRWALARYREGADFADMLHLVSAFGA